MDTQKTADELCEFVHIFKCRATEISDVFRCVSPLTKILEGEYSRVRWRTKKAIKDKNRWAVLGN